MPYLQSVNYFSLTLSQDVFVTADLINKDTGKKAEACFLCLVESPLLSSHHTVHDKIRILKVVYELQLQRYTEVKKLSKNQLPNFLNSKYLHKFFYI